MATAKRLKTLAVEATRDVREYAQKACDERGADLTAAIEVLTRLHNEREELIQLRADLDCFWTEGLAATHRVMEKEFGYNTTSAPINPFTGEKMPVSYLALKVGPDETVNVTQSRFQLPGLEITVMPRWVGPWEFQLHAQLRKKHEPEFQDFVAKVKAEVAARSIYRHNMLEMKFEDDDGEDVMQPPEPIHPPKLLPKDLILPTVTQAYIDLELFQFVRHTEVNRQHSIPMNRKVLLAGKYGTGKTLTAGVLANVCRASGWTFFWFKPSVQLRNPYDALRKVLEMATHYQPAIVFMEDIDQLLGRERDSLVNEVVNTLDGIIGKDSELLFVATTNSPEALDPVTLRRFDLLVSFELPDAQAAEKLIRLYAGDLLPKAVSLTEVGKVLAGHAPSIIASAVEAAKRAATYRGHDLGIAPAMEPEDILHAAQARAQHVQLIDRPPRIDRAPLEQVADAMVKAADIVVTGKPNGHLLPQTSVRA